VTPRASPLFKILYAETKIADLLSEILTLLTGLVADLVDLPAERTDLVLKRAHAIEQLSDQITAGRCATGRPGPAAPIAQE
jgi:hypothetical protein